jgi:DNA-binding NarL/FixJ family response regulator
VHEVQDTAAAIRRFVAALGRRLAAEGDVSDLAIFGQLKADLEQARTAAVLGLRAQGFTDTQIARGLGIRQQSVSERWPSGGGQREERWP